MWRIISVFAPRAGFRVCEWTRRCWASVVLLSLVGEVGMDNDREDQDGLDDSDSDDADFVPE
ncbi:unnamed protein product, partial [Allacma fusca]